MSIAGQLQHAVTVVKPGRTFIGRLFDLSATVTKPNHHIRLKQTRWWQEFLELWNGVSLLLSLGEEHPSIVLTSDASGLWGCGAWRCFQFAWEELQDASIATKELLPIVFNGDGIMGEVLRWLGGLLSV